jgi:hypothetical protein
MKTGNVIAIMLSWCVASACDAQQVIYACRDAHGGRVYQDAPCAAEGLREVGSRTYATPRDPPDAARRLEAIDRQVHADWAHERWGNGGTVRRRALVSDRVSLDGRELDRRRCHAARAAVDRATRSRTFRGDRAALEEAAVDACFAL